MERRRGARSRRDADRGVDTRILQPLVSTSFALLLATKLEAFRRRGGDDYLASVDLEDVVRLVDGRERLVDELASAPVDVREFVATELRELLEDPRFEAGVAAALLPDEASQGRRGMVVERLSRMTDIGAA